MLNDSLSARIFIRIAIFALQSIGPLSLAWTTLIACDILIHGKSLSSLRLPGLQTYVAAEALFYLLFLWYRRHLQREAIHPPLRSREERKQLIDQVRNEIHDVDRFLSGWFRGANPDTIGRDDLKSFLAWVFWEGRSTEEDAEELEEYTQVVEGLAGHAFPERKGTARALRLTLDPIDMAVRSLAWYGIIMLVDHITFVRFWAAGFSYRRTSVARPWVFPPRPAALLVGGNMSPARKLSYWVRPHTSKTRLPVLFIHGIGVGLETAVETLKALNKQKTSSDGDIGILALEVLPISSRLTSPILRRDEFIRQITTILDAHGYDEFVLVSHSYGSVFSSYMLTHEALVSRISATVLLDPVTILLHMPDVAFNFTVRAPRTANEWQLWYFASQDPQVAHTLGRHFFWYENCLWRSRIEELLRGGMRMTVSLASRDLIVDTKAVARYLTDNAVPDPVLETEGGHDHMELEADGQATSSEPWKERPWTGRGLDILWCEDLDHAQVFDDPVARARLVRVVRKYTEKGASSMPRRERYTDR